MPLDCPIKCLRRREDGKRSGWLRFPLPHLGNSGLQPGSDNCMRHQTTPPSLSKKPEPKDNSPTEVDLTGKRH